MAQVVFHQNRDRGSRRGSSYAATMIGGNEFQAFMEFSTGDPQLFSSHMQKLNKVQRKDILPNTKQRVSLTSPVIQVTPGINSKIHESNTFSYNARNFPLERDIKEMNQGKSQIPDLPLVFNPNCYCTERQCLGVRTYLFTSYVCVLVLVVPMLALSADILIFIRAEGYQTSSRMGLDQLLNIYRNTNMNQTLPIPIEEQKNQLDQIIYKYDNCAIDFSINNQFTLNNQRIPSIDQLNITKNSLYSINGNRTAAFKQLLFDYTIKEFFRPILLLGGVLSILWVSFFRSVILLTKHKNLVSTFCSTLLYGSIPAVTFISIIETCKNLIGEQSIKCSACRVSQREEFLGEYDGDSWSYSYTDAIDFDNMNNQTSNATTTKSPFICSQNDNIEIILLLISIGLKFIDQMISGYLLLLSTGRGILRIEHHHTCKEIINRLLALATVFFGFLILTPLLFVAPYAIFKMMEIFSYIDFQSSVYYQTFYWIFNNTMFINICNIVGYCVLGLWCLIGGGLVVLILYRFWQFCVEKIKGS